MDHEFLREGMERVSKAGGLDCFERAKRVPAGTKHERIDKNKIAHCVGNAARGGSGDLCGMWRLRRVGKRACMHVTVPVQDRST